MKFIKQTSLAVIVLILMAACGGGADSVQSAQPIISSAIKGSATCDVTINKTCLVYAPVAQFAADKCDGKLTQFTVVWNGPDGVNISGLVNDTNNELVYIGDEVTFKGPFSQNDVVVTINKDGYRYGESVFHMSCSDENFNSADDCKKPAGDGKSNDGAYKNEWLLEGFVDNSDQVLDCTPNSSDDFPTAKSCDVTDMPGMDCEALGKPTALTFIYHQGTECNSSANTQGDKTECTDSGILSGPVSIKILSDQDKFQLSTYNLSYGESVDITPTGSSFPSSFKLQLSDGSSSQTLNIHLSCSAPLAVGDVFGALELTSFNGQDGSIDVIYGYEVTNNSVLNTFSIIDSNDSVVFDSDTAQSFSLDVNQTSKFTSSASVLIGTSSYARVEDTIGTCGTSNDVPVNKVEAPCMLSLEIYKIEDDKIKYKIYNDGDKDVTLSDVVFAWPGDGLLKKVKFDGNDIIDNVELESPVSFDQFLKEPKDRLLKAGDNTKIEFEFTQKFPLKDKQTAEDFTYTFGFGDGQDCSLSNDFPNGAVREIVFRDMNNSGDLDSDDQREPEVKVTFTYQDQSGVLVTKTLLTNSKGEASLYRLPVDTKVDIYVDVERFDNLPLAVGTNPTKDLRIVEGATVVDKTGFAEVP